MAGEKGLFVVLRQYGPPYDPTQPLEAQLDWEAHRVFMNGVEADGLVRLGGPLGGSGEVLLVFRATNPREIDERLAEDPWTRSGILSTARIVPWDLPSAAFLSRSSIAIGRAPWSWYDRLLEQALDETRVQHLCDTPRALYKRR